MIVWLGLAAADVISAIAYFHNEHNTAPFETLLSATIWLGVLTIFKDVGILGVRHVLSATLHRKWRGWLNSQFNEALLDANHTHFHLQHFGKQDGLTLPPPDNVDQRVQESIKDLTGGAIGLAMGAVGAVAAVGFVGYQLVSTATDVPGLEFLGPYGSAILAAVAVIAYVPLSTIFALRLGRIMQRLANSMQQAEGSYRGELNTMLRRSFQVAASGAEAVQKQMHSRLYSDIDATWSKLVFMQAGYQSFERVYNFVANRIVAYLPQLGPYMQGYIGLKSYVAGAEMVNSVIIKVSWIIQVMPEIATLRANSTRVIDLACAIERVQSPPDFYGGPARSDFRFNHDASKFVLSVNNLTLTHEGDEGKAFVNATDLYFKPGEWTYLKGESGCGKTSLIKAINGLWPYGSGDISIREGLRAFYAAQDVKLPRLSLKELICLPDADEHYSDARAAAALHKSGLGDFIEHLGSLARDGKNWEDLLSGGQKQRLVLARIVLHKPDILFLDEATGALDPGAKIDYHQAIRDNCPDATVISVMHEAHPPRSASGKPFYDSVLSFADGFVVKHSVAEVGRPQLALVVS